MCTWKNIAMSPTCLQKCVTGYPQCPLHGWDSKKPSQEVFGLGLPICFFLALSQMAGLMVTWLPPGKIHLLEQINTPKQDFFRMFTLWLFVFLMAQPLEWRLASSHVAVKIYLQWPSAHSGHKSKPEQIWNKKNTLGFQGISIIWSDNILTSWIMFCPWIRYNFEVSSSV